MTDKPDERQRRRQVQTMQELSALIGVSRPTLSRYFQSPESVRGTTVAKIRQGLEQIDYVPNFFATRMNRKSTGIIGVVIPYLNDLFFTKLLQAVEVAAMAQGFTVITQSSHSDPEIEARAAETLMSMSVDGAIVAPLGNQTDPEVHARLAARLPFVLIDSLPETLPDVDYVGTNHDQSTGLIVDYLARRGEAPVYLAMPPGNFNAIGRERAYLRRMSELGLEPTIIGDRALGDDPYEGHGNAVLAAEFGRGNLLDRSILCVNDRVAIGALRAAGQHGLTPGRQGEGGLRIAGHDDYPLCPFTVPSLTTVAQDLDAIANRAVTRLIAKIRGDKGTDVPEITLFDGTLKVRESA